MRIAFFGGSFDPPHRGHLAIARAALERLRLERVLFAPVGRQPLKRDAAPTSYEDRCAMVELAIAGDPKMELSLIDAPRPDGGPNYTIDTLRELSATLAPDDELFCLVGADSFLTLKQWHQAEELLLTYNFIVAARPGFALADLAGTLPDSLAATLTRVRVEEMDPACQLFHAGGTAALYEPKVGGAGASRSGHNAYIYVLPDLDEDISATEVRTALASPDFITGVAELETGAPGTGKRGHGAVPPIPFAVFAYIKSHQLYTRSRP